MPRHVAIIAGGLDVSDPVTRSIIDLANELARSGLTISLLVFDGIEAELEPGVTVITCGFKSKRLSLGLLRARRWVAQTLAELNADQTISLHCNFPADIVIPMRGLLQSRIDSSLRNADGFFERIVGRLTFLLPSILISSWFEKKTLTHEGLRSIVGLSPQIVASLREANLSPTATVHEASLPIEPACVDTAETGAMRGQMARALGIESDAYWVVFAFRRSGLHGLETLLRAFKPFAEQRPQSVLLLAGPTRYTHLAWIAELGLRDRVRFVGTTERLDLLMPCIDLAVYPTHYDPVGWGVRDALRLGKPLITTTASDLAEAVASSGGVVISSPAQPDDLLQAIRTHHAQWQAGRADSTASTPIATPQAQPLARFVMERLADSP